MHVFWDWFVYCYNFSKVRVKVRRYQSWDPWYEICICLPVAPTVMEATGTKLRGFQIRSERFGIDFANYMCSGIDIELVHGRISLPLSSDCLFQLLPGYSHLSQRYLNPSCVLWKYPVICLAIVAVYSHSLHGYIQEVPENMRHNDFFT